MGFFAQRSVAEGSASPMALPEAGSNTPKTARPLLPALLLPQSILVVGVSAASLLLRALLGAIGARAGGATVGKAMLRVTF